VTIHSLHVPAHQNELLAEAAAERLARTARTPADRQNRLVDAVKSGWSLITGPADRPVGLPPLSDYPYRS
jgi:hypothetical protein